VELGAQHETLGMMTAYIGRNNATTMVGTIRVKCVRSNDRMSNDRMSSEYSVNGGDCESDTRYKYNVRVRNQGKVEQNITLKGLHSSTSQAPSL
jgi:hypothetical protein